MKKNLTLLLAAAALLQLSACSGGETAATTASTTTTAVSSEATTTAAESEATAASESEAPADTTVSSEQSDDEQYEITLCADFSSGSERAEELNLIRTKTETVDEVTPEAIAAALSEWSGLDFFINGYSIDESSVTIDWAADSTLIGGLDNRELKEDFIFYDVDSINWFMMDSLRTTVIENMGDCDVYYTMDGGQELEFSELYPITKFPSDIPYLGSPFYFAHTDGAGDNDDIDYSRTAGMWRLDGEEDTASIYMDGYGSYTAYYASGAIEAEGYLVYVDEYSDGNGRYDMYDLNGTFINGFYFDSNDQIHMGNNGQRIYIRVVE